MEMLKHVAHCGTTETFVS